ncbi:hypothetical protein [Micromonospora sp. NPDC049891]|uniref:hypothetical protein n=1 Tax=Micromonospora sp. NPDC049891 TaxID=3155655 RepID=UPI003411907B
MIEAGQLLYPARLNFYAPTLVYKAFNTERASTTTLADDPELTLPVEAGGVYRMECVLGASGATAGDIKTAWAIPAGAVMNRVAMGPSVSATDRDNMQVVRRVNGAATEISYGLTGSSASTYIEERAVLIMGATSGAITLRWAQATSNATATQLQFNNCWLMLQRVS